MLTEKINAIRHVQEELESSCESLSFANGLMEAFCTDLEQTCHTRKAEMKTMGT